MNPPAPKESKVGAGAAGVGGGTLLVLFANQLGDSFPNLKPWLLLAAPTVTVGLTAVWLWCQVWIGNRMLDHELRTLVAKLKQTLKEALENPNTSPEHRRVIQKMLEEVELKVASRDMKRIDTLAPITFSDVQQMNLNKTN